MESESYFSSAHNVDGASLRSQNALTCEGVDSITFHFLLFILHFLDSCRNDGHADVGAEIVNISTLDCGLNVDERISRHIIEDKGERFKVVTHRMRIFHCLRL